MNDIEIRLARDWYFDGVRGVIFKTEWESTMPKRYVATDFLWQVVEEGQRVDPVFDLEMTKAQKLMDNLWECGLRPTEGAGSAGSLAATQRHLEDIRALLWKEGKPK